MLDLKKHIPKEWSQLVEIQGIKLISSMYIWLFIVPIAAKSLSALGNTAQVTIFQHQFEIQFSLPFSWNVFYFSALFFAGAHLLYNLRCPKLIKQHPTYSSFNREGKPTWHLRGYAEDIGINYDAHVRELEQAMEHNEGQVKTGEEWKQALFWDLIWEAQRCRVKTFYTCLSFYFLGFILIAIVVVQNLWWVISNLFS